MTQPTRDIPFVPVILGGDLGAYAIGREIHEAYGRTSICLASSPAGIIAHSKIFEQVHVSPTKPDEVVGAVRSIVREAAGVPVLVTTSVEACMPSITAIQEQVEGIVTPAASAEVVELVSHKDRFCELCEKHGLDIPATEVVELAGSEPIAPSALPFPVVAKPSYSPEYAHLMGQGFHKVYFMREQRDLDELWERLREAGFTGNFLVQELIGGDDTLMEHITVYIDSSGAPTLFGAAQGLLEDHAPTLLGNPVGMISMPMPELWERCANLLVDIGYRGFANFDIKRDPATGRHLFFEVNPRIGRSSYYLAAAGCNPMVPCVEDLVAGRRLEPCRTERETLYTLVPKHLLMRYVTDPELLARVKRVYASGEVYDPQRYAADAHPRRLLDVTLTELNQYRKFARYYPEPTETSF